MTQQTVLHGEPQDAFAEATRAVTASGGVVTWQSPPLSAKFTLGKKNLWTTGGLTMKYDGALDVQSTGPNEVTARVSLKMNWGSFVPLAATQVVCVIILLTTAPYYASFGLLLLIAGLAYSAWQVSSALPEQALKDVIKAIQSGATGGGATGGGARFTSPPPQSPPNPPPPSSAPSSASPTPSADAPHQSAGALAIMEQIKQLASLRDAGALTPEEFDAKKAELLKRI